jgi:hypothetical protein
MPLAAFERIKYGVTEWYPSGMGFTLLAIRIDVSGYEMPRPGCHCERRQGIHWTIASIAGKGKRARASRQPPHRPVTSRPILESSFGELGEASGPSHAGSQPLCFFAVLYPRILFSWQHFLRRPCASRALSKAWGHSRSSIFHPLWLRLCRAVPLR